jgi:TM2 domain-containing membrane protein YozV
MQAAPMIPPVQQKSTAAAVVLSFLWLGAGHLYLGRIPAGLVLAVYTAVLALMALSLIGFIIAFPIWLVSVAIVMSLAAAATASVNREAALMHQQYHG